MLENYYHLLRLVLPQIDSEDLPLHTRNDVIEALLAVSKIGDTSNRQTALDMAAGILGAYSPEFLWGAIAHAQSVLSRLRADFNDSEHFIEEFCCRSGHLDCSESSIRDFYRRLQPNSVSKRLNAIYGRLHVSHLENLVQCDQYSSAVDEVDDWRTSQNPSMMECRVLPGQAVTVAKIHRSQGTFAEAQASLESCLKLLLPQDVNRIQVLCSLADMYCDLGFPEEACAKLTPEIEIERIKGMQGKAFRRLLVSAIDADVGKRSYGSGERTVGEVQAIFSGLSNLDVSDQLLHVRVLIASARIVYYKSHFSEAQRKWEDALDHVQRYASFQGEGFTYAAIHLSICLVHIERGNNRDGREAFECAEKILCMSVRDFWIPTLATRWIPDILARVKTLTGWELCGSDLEPCGAGTSVSLHLV